MLALVSAFAAGVLTTVNPCVLPVLPVILATAFSGGRFGPAALVGGLVLGFTVIGATLAATGTLLGLSQDGIRLAAGMLFVAAGLVYLVPALKERLATALQPLADRAAQASTGADTASLAGQATIGLMLGAIWTPCSGPSLGAAIGLAARADGLGEAVLRMAVFGMGAGVVLLALAYGSRAAMRTRRDGLMRAARIAGPIAGAIFVCLGLLVLTGLDKRLEALATEWLPDWLVDITTSV